jgi:hypothetical protein
MAHRTPIAGHRIRVSPLGNAATRHFLHDLERDRSASADLGMFDVPSQAIVERGITFQAMLLVPLPVHFSCCSLARSMLLKSDCAISHSWERAS